MKVGAPLAWGLLPVEKVCASCKGLEECALYLKGLDWFFWREWVFGGAVRHSASRELKVGLESDTDREVGTCPAGARRLGWWNWGSWGEGKDEPHDGSHVLSSWAGLDVLLVVNLGPL